MSEEQQSAEVQIEHPPTSEGSIAVYYPIYFNDNNYKKLFAIQSAPSEKVWFKDTEITMAQLVEMLQRLPVPVEEDKIQPAVPDFVIARMCYEVNRMWCELNGDYSMKEWEDAEEWQRISMLKGVRWRLENPGAPESAQHEAWLKDRQADGWKWAPVKDAAAKEHPNIMPYNELPTVQKKKDSLFIAIVNALK